MRFVTISKAAERTTDVLNIGIERRHRTRSAHIVGMTRTKIGPISVAPRKTKNDISRPVLL
jgi:hypothetical protein